MAVEMCYIRCWKKSRSITFLKKKKNRTKTKNTRNANLRKHIVALRRHTRAQGCFPSYCWVLVTYRAPSERSRDWCNNQLLSSSQHKAKQGRRKRCWGVLVVVACGGGEVEHRCFSKDQPLTNNAVWIEGQRRRPLIFFFPPPSHLILGRVILLVTLAQSFFSICQIPAPDLCLCLEHVNDCSVQTHTHTLSDAPTFSQPIFFVCAEPDVQDSAGHSFIIYFVSHSKILLRPQQCLICLLYRSTFRRKKHFVSYLPAITIPNRKLWKTWTFMTRGWK